jgi:two-component system response regulator (stage 0 sporulation protein A)
MVTLEQKIDLIMQYIVAEDAEEKNQLKTEITNALSESAAPSESTTDISSYANDALMTNTIDDLLRELGAPCHLTGYDKVVYAIKLVILNPDYLDKITHRLYPEVAKTYNTTASRVERAIRHLVEVAWLRHDTEDAFRIFGNTIDVNRGKPTNSEFIANCARIVKRRMREKM